MGYLFTTEDDLKEQTILYDNNKTLVLLNPTVSSYKTVIQEQKVETIGNKFPFYFRNPTINYKEFSIGGLITNYNETGNTNLTNINFKAEREYKNEILAWLNNGQVKIFYAPSEGNYAVRLTGISLSPETQLGRMLHSFSATATQISTCNDSGIEPKWGSFL